VSRFFSEKYAKLVPYTPGEQPKDQCYVKLNTNESPFPPSPKAQIYAAEAAMQLQLYSDPQCTKLVEAAAKKFGVAQDQILFNNGSDEGLNFAFMAFCDEQQGAAFPDISYGFYPVFAQLNHVPYQQIPLREDYSICPEDYFGLNKTIFIANPNAPTGMALSLADIERIVAANPNHVVVIDEAYVDFGCESAVPLIHKYDNLLVIQTFSKSRSLAGGRLGFCIGNANLIHDLQTIKYSTNPYNVNSMTIAAGVGALEDEESFRENCLNIQKNRAWTVERLCKIGFSVLDSKANFVFAAHNRVPGEKLYLQLKARGVLVRYFDKDRLRPYIRITIGSLEQMQVLLGHLKEILEEE